MSWGERWTKFWTFVWKNLDGLAVIVVAFIVIALQIVGNPSPELKDSAILGLLGVTAIILLRDRVGRDDLAALSQVAGDALSDRPYEVVWQKNLWDITDRKHVRVKVTEQLRFTRNDVATIAHWSRGDGTVEFNKAMWRRSQGHQWSEAKKVHEFSAKRGGEKVIYCFDSEHNRGDVLEWTIEREIIGRFPSPSEGVSLEARTRSDHPRVMRIIWPVDVEPSNVAIRIGSQPVRELKPRKKDGRYDVEEKVAGLAINQTVEISWNW